MYYAPKIGISSNRIDCYRLVSKDSVIMRNDFEFIIAGNKVIKDIIKSYFFKAMPQQVITHKKAQLKD